MFECSTLNFRQTEIDIIRDMSMDNMVLLCVEIISNI